MVALFCAIVMFYFVFLFILGTIVGSFLNVCIHRLPRGESIISPPSRCPRCKQNLKVIDLIPIFGYFILRGRCRYCKVPISFRYPLVEFVTGILFMLSAIRFPAMPLEFLFSIIFISLLVIIFFIDLEQLVIPDAISISGIFFGLTFNFLRALVYQKTGILNPFLSALFGMLIGYIFLCLIRVLGKILFKKEAMGEGDLYLGALLGACLGWQGVFISIIIAYLLAGIVSLVLLGLGKVKMGEYVPFGPALVGGGILSLFFDQQIINWYLGLF